MILVLDNALVIIEEDASTSLILLATSRPEILYHQGPSRCAGSAASGHRLGSVEATRGDGIALDGWGGPGTAH